MRTPPTTGYGPGRITTTGLAVLVTLALAGCSTTVKGTPWAEGQGPALPPGVAAPPTAEQTPTTSSTPPTSFTVPGPLPTGTPTPTTSPAPGTGAAETTRTVPPIPVRTGASTIPDGRARPATPRTTVATPVPTTLPPRTAAPATPPPLTSDVVRDECLLDGPSLTGLLGTAPSGPASNAQIRRPDGARIKACFAVGGTSTVSINVYTTNRITPARYVRDAAGARRLSGTVDGTVAAVLDTVAGPTLQLATARYLVTIAVAGRAPSDDQWRGAVRVAASTLPR